MVIFIGLAVLGCQSISTVDPNYAREVAADVNEMNARVDIYQKVATAAIESLVASGAIDPNGAKKVLAANADLDQCQSIVRAVAAGLHSAEYSGGVGLVTIIEGAIAANAASAPWNPYAAVIAAALTILSTLLGLQLKKKSGEVVAVGKKYKAHKTGVEKTMKEVSVASDEKVKAVEGMLFNNIGEARGALGVT